MSAVATELTAGTWTANPASTRAGFRARDVLGRSVHGTLSALSAAVEVSTSGLPLHVRADLDLTSVATGNPRRDADLVDLDGGAQVCATATLDRRLVGITMPRLLVGRLVAVEVDAVLHAPGA